MTEKEILTNTILDDIETYKNIGDKYTHKMIQSFMELIRDTTIPDHHIEDINARIGMYDDESNFHNIDSMTAFKQSIDKYHKYAFSMGLRVISNNIQKLKNYKGEGSIYE